MKGKVLDFSVAENAGVISGDDGNRYRFTGPDWKSGSTHPVAGAKVDYIGTEGVATEIYVDVPAAGTWTPPPPLPEGLDERYRGVYCSSDEKMVLGLCGGLAHKFGVQLGLMRAIVFLVMMFFLWIPYLVGIFLPKLPTKGVPRVP